MTTVLTIQLSIYMLQLCLLLNQCIFISAQDISLWEDDMDTLQFWTGGSVIHSQTNCNSNTCALIRLLNHEHRMIHDVTSTTTYTSPIVLQYDITTFIDDEDTLFIAYTVDPIGAIAVTWTTVQTYSTTVSLSSQSISLPAECSNTAYLRIKFAIKGEDATDKAYIDNVRLFTTTTTTTTDHPTFGPTFNPTTNHPTTFEPTFNPTFEPTQIKYTSWNGQSNGQVDSMDMNTTPNNGNGHNEVAVQGNITMDNMLNYIIFGLIGISLCVCGILCGYFCKRTTSPNNKNSRADNEMNQNDESTEIEITEPDTGITIMSVNQLNSIENNNDIMPTCVPQILNIASMSASLPNDIIHDIVDVVSSYSNANIALASHANNINNTNHAIVNLRKHNKTHSEIQLEGTFENKHDNINNASVLCAEGDNGTFQGQSYFESDVMNYNQYKINDDNYDRDQRKQTLGGPIADDEFVVGGDDDEYNACRRQTKGYENENENENENDNDDANSECNEPLNENQSDAASDTAENNNTNNVTMATGNNDTVAMPMHAYVTKGDDYFNKNTNNNKHQQAYPMNNDNIQEKAYPMNATKRNDTEIIYNDNDNELIPQSHFTRK